MLSLLSEVGLVGVPHLSPASVDSPDWAAIWSEVASRLIRDLESLRVTEFERGFQIVRDAIAISEPVVRQAAVAALFGDFTRRAIGAGIDRTRFVDWFGPPQLFTAPAGRVRGRVLYFNLDKGRGKILGSDRVIYFVHFSAILGTGFRSVSGGTLVEFTPCVGVSNAGEGMLARDVERLTEDGTIYVGPDAGSQAPRTH